MTLPTRDITGLVVCGGRGTRMGGADKGLQPHRGQPLALHALLRLKPQVGRLMVNANRNLDAYAALGVPVWPDPWPDFQGPLAGWLAGLTHCETPILAAVPCDTPNFPTDLVARLAQALDADAAEIAMAATREAGVLQPQPVFCLLRASLTDSLLKFLQGGGRKIAHWTALHRCVTVEFSDTPAFFNANTPAELQRLQAGAPPLPR